MALGWTSFPEQAQPRPGPGRLGELRPRAWGGLQGLRSGTSSEAAAVSQLPAAQAEGDELGREDV